MFTLRLALRFLATAVVAVGQQYVISTVAGSRPEGTPNGLGNMAGYWEFSAWSSVSDLSLSVDVPMAQIGNSISGQFNVAVSGQIPVSGMPCLTQYGPPYSVLSGTLSNAGLMTMNLMSVSGQVVIVLSGILSADGNYAMGTYTASSGGCMSGDKGTWSGHRWPPSNGTAVGDGGPAIEASLDVPNGVAVDGTGAFYISQMGSNEDNPRIRKVSSNGVITAVAGNGTNGFAGDGGPAISALLYAPFGVWVDSLGNLYIADTGNDRVRKVSPNGIINTVAGIGPGLTGHPYSISGVPATTALLYSPWALATDSLGNLFIAQGGLDIVSKVSSSGIITTMAGNATRGYSGDGGSALKAQLAAPSGVAVDSTGNVFIADTNNARIRKVSPSGTITTVAGNGIQGYGGDGGKATSAQLKYPGGIALDSAGNLYVADSGNNRIRKLASDGIISTIAGNGLHGYSGDGGAATNAELNGPNSLSVDSTGNIFVADTQNNAIRLLQPTGFSPSISAVTNAATNLPGAIAPGEIVVLYGSGLGPAQLVTATVGSDGLYDPQLAGTGVTINGLQAPMIYAWATQTAAVVPYGITGTTALVSVAYQGQSSAALSVPVASSAPGIFSFDSTGKGQAAAINQDGFTINGAANPAKVGDVISLYATGEGQTTPFGTDGKPASAPLPHPNLSVGVTIGGQTTQVQYAGGAPGEVAGVVQVNVQIPAGIQTGNAVPVLLSVGNASSQAGVTVAVH